VGVQNDRKDSAGVGNAVRFACGAVFGMVLGFWVLVEMSDLPRFVGGVLAAGLLGGFLSVRFGERFWRAVANLRWFVP
jgi:hypothetical protein